jgi:hypothetical protein
MFKPFSKRKRAPKPLLDYKLSQRVRNRLMYAMQDLIDPGCMPGTVSEWTGFYKFLRDAEAWIRHEFGTIEPPLLLARTNSGFPAIDYFIDINDERAIDLLEFFFRWREYRQGQRGVDRINAILREEGVGYELSRFVDRSEEVDNPQYGGKTIRYWVEAYPEAIKKSDELVHAEVVMPTLELLAGTDWKAANEHMLKAHEHYRKGNNREAISECGAALETVLKVICQKKRWTYTPDKDVLSALVEVCNRHGLFYPFYVEVLKNSGTIRNKLGAHGREPTPTFTAEESHVEHMIHLVSSHILFLAQAAGLR